MVGLYQSQAASDVKLFTFQESTRICKSGQLSDYGHRSQISARQYLQESPEKLQYDLLGDHLLGWLPVVGNGHLLTAQRTVKDR